MRLSACFEPKTSSELRGSRIVTPKSQGFDPFDPHNARMDVVDALGALPRYALRDSEKARERTRIGPSLARSCLTVCTLRSSPKSASECIGTVLMSYPNRERPLRGSSKKHKAALDGFLDARLFVAYHLKKSCLPVCVPAAARSREGILPEQIGVLPRARG